MNDSYVEQVQPRRVVATIENATEFIFRYEVSGSLVYLGEAVPGAATSDPMWKIQLFDATSTSILYANGNPGYAHVWDDRASLSYS